MKQLIAKLVLLSSVVLGGTTLFAVNVSGSVDTAASNALSASAANAEPVTEIQAAHRVVEDATSELLVLIESARDYVAEDEARFYDELGALLRKYVDFNAFARGVMGKYVAPQRLEKLSDDDRTELEGQITEFTAIFSNALINTYGKAVSYTHLTLPTSPKV